MTDSIQVTLTVALPALTVLVGIMVNNSRLTDLKDSLNGRISDLEAKTDVRFSALEAKMDTRSSALEAKMDARFSAIDERFVHMDRRLDDIRDMLRAEIRRVEGILDLRLQHIEQR